ncbi:MAG: AAA family ATPase [Actinophytocola sp.]|uniref:TetR/AcrR family transcriptional regulator C-terminal ligand-binding domain-containing protein n=1 Tax=Actinophytocola sp. TaxID=1872138 RepID=UPI0013237B3C|nr:TetR/AcrR family transcriptional regulator C-terminal ligand-binding domain-containing protein [Actinophytocola sp.]MPZ84544.1 AAA family ATPase [Actinophytocola sp.]
MVADLLASMAEESVPRTETGTLLGDLRANARLVRETLSDPRQGRLFKAVIAASTWDTRTAEALHRSYEIRVAEWSPCVTRAVEQGELPPDTDPAELIRAVSAPLYYRLLTTSAPLDEAAHGLSRVRSGAGGGKVAGAWFADVGDTHPMARRVSVPEMVGRRAELAVLDALLPGDTRLVLVDGDAGVGKTRLVQAFVARVGGRATVLRGGCLQFEADIPYAPFAEALPDLFGEEATGAPTGDRVAAYRRVAEAVTRAGDLVVLVLEDLHWADASTRDLLRHLHRALADADVLIVATCRSDELTADHPVATLVTELARSPRTERLHLDPLDRPGVAALARAVLDAEPAPDLVDQLVARAEGNPFFTEELLAAWPGSGDVPRTVRDIVLTRLARLSKNAQHLARLASVAGRTVPHDLLQGLGALPEDELGTALRELVDHGQLTTAGSDAYAFRHALIHESLYRDLLPGERRAATPASPGTSPTTPSWPDRDPRRVPPPSSPTTGTPRATRPARSPRRSRRLRPRSTGSRRPRRTPTTSVPWAGGGRPPNVPRGSPTTRSSSAPRRPRASPATTSARSS